MTGPGASHDVTTTARVLVGAATATLPSGAVRERYRREHLGELSALPSTDQVHYAVGALMTSWALRRAVSKETDMTSTSIKAGKPLLCRLNLHHRYRKQYNPAGEVYRQVHEVRQGRPGRPATRPAPAPDAVRLTADGYRPGCLVRRRDAGQAAVAGATSPASRAMTSPVAPSRTAARPTTKT